MIHPIEFMLRIASDLITRYFEPSPNTIEPVSEFVYGDTDDQPDT